MTDAEPEIIRIKKGDNLAALAVLLATALNDRRPVILLAQHHADERALIARVVHRVTSYLVIAKDPRNTKKLESRERVVDHVLDLVEREFVPTGGWKS